MNKTAWMLLLFLSAAGTALAEDMPATPAATDEAPAGVLAAPAEEAPAAIPADTTAAPAISASAVEPALTDNLEFVSGEVSALDEANKSLTVRLYGETEDAASDKSLSVTVDETTDITDGEQDRELKSLAVGTEVDVEYDPANNKATYIFVY